MSELINIADDLYDDLTRLKKVTGASYTEVIREYVPITAHKTGSHQDILVFIKALEKEFTGPKEKVDIDKIAYGVSREGS